ncbi:hypothetical protein EX30DRAFT_368837 [Ascodesmis nigricans]|uniref:Uncharacterized protein n=1 Tax=Ascodesmis nigricans TaxID=341454 RepID=A0A4S2N2X2_9PEZI|nr:hypothetical protein EX30DRAFT_368837 [Ascodesmis nigricans]
MAPFDLNHIQMAGSPTFKFVPRAQEGQVFLDFKDLRIYPSNVSLPKILAAGGLDVVKKEPKMPASKRQFIDISRDDNDDHHQQSPTMKTTLMETLSTHIDKYLQVRLSEKDLEASSMALKSSRRLKEKYRKRASANIEAEKKRKREALKSLEDVKNSFV